MKCLHVLLVAELFQYYPYTAVSVFVAYFIFIWITGKRIFVRIHHKNTIEEHIFPDMVSSEKEKDISFYEDQFEQGLKDLLSASPTMLDDQTLIDFFEYARKLKYYYPQFDMIEDIMNDYYLHILNNDTNENSPFQGKTNQDIFLNKDMKKMYKQMLKIMKRDKTNYYFYI